MDRKAAAFKILRDAFYKTRLTEKVPVDAEALSVVLATENDVRDFARAALHGNDVHRAWLLEAAEAFKAGRPLPQSRHATVERVAS